MNPAVFALADASRGTLLEAGDDEDVGAGADLAALAAALPELSAASPVDWERVFDPDKGDHERVQSFVFVSGAAIHVVLCASSDEDVALVGSTPPERRVGTLLAAARAYVARRAESEGRR